MNIKYPSKEEIIFHLHKFEQLYKANYDGWPTLKVIGNSQPKFYNNIDDLLEFRIYRDLNVQASWVGYLLGTQEK